MAQRFEVSDARAFYDKFGKRQDSQGFYEDRSLDALVRHARFREARSVFELGCGTGRFAARLLSQELPQDARYVGVDLSTTMVGLARERLASFGDRARVEPTDGGARQPFSGGSFDRVVSSYVLDLLEPDQIRDAIAEARRLLTPSGLLCLASLGVPSRGGLARFVAWGWGKVRAMSPSLVGGCRPLRLLEFFDRGAWNIIHHEEIVQFCVPSVVLVAAPVHRA